ncbi:DUF4249 domain-containing protein [Mucilaginibacter polytrichastri]|uniref:DUF4249 domain-containing protein n=1 Tax=Mucilaginibacter polytrichastri TaxID=1302689 RepID=A0A1Q6A3Q1_9SPHI|nr:DUF4249 domain-containing protein [Mucilaginibacter polytrichastri]OKS88635.1 hypothetical protein RG47T_4107 [Mucilaginibacter polytrichastri]SFT26384.1 protein of unknown function [Mucilaginibacter polytrichastri]
MKNLKSIIFILVTVITFASCQKTIVPPLPGSTPQLVIEGAVSDTAGPYHINISKTVGFYADNTYPNVSGASVTITDQTAGVTDLLTETSAGIYTTHVINGKPGSAYQLKVVVDGKTYLSTSTMPYPVVLDSVSFDYTSIKNMIQPVAHFQDPTKATNFYKFNIQKNGVNLNRFQTQDDLLSNGKYIRTALVTDTGAIKKNDHVSVSLVGIDKGAYNFLQEAESVAFYNDQLATPSTPESNISGGCIGYFSAQTVSKKNAIVTK